jgi:hypothetical protein
MPALVVLLLALSSCLLTVCKTLTTDSLSLVICLFPNEIS